MEKKEEILYIIKRQPMISQDELAARVGLSRSAAAGYISRLMKEGAVLGKAYVFPPEKQILCIGGANIDRKLHVQALRWRDSNPASSTQSIGGTALNAAYVLYRRERTVSLVTMTGEDAAGRQLMEQIPFDTSYSLKTDTAPTGTYTAVFQEGEMEAAFADMAVYDQLLPEKLSRHQPSIKGASALLMDSNLPQETIRWLLSQAADSQMTVLVPVSAAKMERIPLELHGLNLIILNEKEAEVWMEQHHCSTLSDTIRASGAAAVMKTKGSRGAELFTAEGHVYEQPAVPVETADVTGAGDTSAAVMTEALLDGRTWQEAMKEAAEASAAVVSGQWDVYSD
ncbi:carbohydrate kinase [Alkalicoccus chagannorensis]|uniref:carbohydrate kinase n=1 Tax=Alkalicoccus chagannorensis TaxID=427072 RepID=UPI0004250CC6|nr:carbohydrate kinase [Alkalicoccus chagannorensis]